MGLHHAAAASSAWCHTNRRTPPNPRRPFRVPGGPIGCTLIAMLPCTHLWAWLAQKLTDDPVSGLDPVKNVYAFWIKDNLSFGGSHRIGNFIDTFMKEHPGEIDEAKAMRIYTEGMKHEQANFASP